MPKKNNKFVNGFDLDNDTFIEGIVQFLAPSNLKDQKKYNEIKDIVSQDFYKNKKQIIQEGVNGLYGLRNRRFNYSNQNKLQVGMEIADEFMHGTQSFLEAYKSVLLDIENIKTTINAPSFIDPSETAEIDLKTEAIIKKIIALLLKLFKSSATHNYVKSYLPYLSSLETTKNIFKALAQSASLLFPAYTQDCQASLSAKEQEKKQWPFFYYWQKRVLTFVDSANKQIKQQYCFLLEYLLPFLDRPQALLSLRSLFQLSNFAHTSHFFFLEQALLRANQLGPSLKEQITKNVQASEKQTEGIDFYSVKKIFDEELEKVFERLEDLSNFNFSILKAQLEKLISDYYPNSVPQQFELAIKKRTQSCISDSNAFLLELDEKKSKTKKNKKNNSKKIPKQQLESLTQEGSSNNACDLINKITSRPSQTKEINSFQSSEILHVFDHFLNILNHIENGLKKMINTLKAAILIPSIAQVDSRCRLATLLINQQPQSNLMLHRDAIRSQHTELLAYNTNENLKILNQHSSELSLVLSKTDNFLASFIQTIHHFQYKDFFLASQEKFENLKNTFIENCKQLDQTIINYFIAEKKIITIKKRNNFLKKSETQALQANTNKAKNAIQTYVAKIESLIEENKVLETLLIKDTSTPITTPATASQPIQQSSGSANIFYYYYTYYLFDTLTYLHPVGVLLPITISLAPTPVVVVPEGSGQGNEANVNGKFPSFFNLPSANNLPIMPATLIYPSV